MIPDFIVIRGDLNSSECFGEAKEQKLGYFIISLEWNPENS